MAAWYFVPPQPSKGPPAWDTCWDFSKYGRQGVGYDAYQMQVPTVMAPPWAGWAMQPTMQPAMQPATFPSVPPWWPAESPYAVPTHWPAQPMAGDLLLEAMATPGSLVGGAGAPVAAPAGAGTAAEDGATAPLPKALEKRLADKRGTEPAPAPAPAPPSLPDKEFEGSLKSLSKKHGYGFIACEEIYRIFHRDVYLSQDIVPETIQVLDRVRFKVELSAKGRPQASWAEVVALTAAAA